MQPIALILACLGFVILTHAAPIPEYDRNLALVPRGRIYKQLHHIGHDPRPKDCGEHAEVCYQAEVKVHTLNINQDINQDFRKWQEDVQEDFKRFMKDMQHDRSDFKEQYDAFRFAIDLELRKASLNPKHELKFPAWDIKFHIAWIWEMLGKLKTDIREDLYAALVDLSTTMHYETKVQYSTYPIGCGAVLLQIQTLNNYFGRHIDTRSLETELFVVHMIAYRNIVVEDHPNPRPNHRHSEFLDM